MRKIFRFKNFGELIYYGFLYFTIHTIIVVSLWTV